MVPFAETVWYRQQRAGGGNQRSLATRCQAGVWLGHTRNSSEVLIGTTHGVVNAWAVRRRPQEERWTGEIISKMTATPKDPSGLQIGAPAQDQNELITEDPPSQENSSQQKEEKEKRRVS